AGAVGVAQAGQLMPGVPAVGGAEDGGVLDAGIYDLWVSERRLEVPDALELPGVLRAVVPLVGGERLSGVGGSVVEELVAFALGHAAGAGGGPAARGGPGFSAV